MCGPTDDASHLMRPNSTKLLDLLEIATESSSSHMLQSYNEVLSDLHITVQEPFTIGLFDQSYSKTKQFKSPPKRQQKPHKPPLKRATNINKKPTAFIASLENKLMSR